MALILNIETSTKVCSVALGKDGECIESSTIHDDKYSHAEKLNILIEALMQQVGIELGQLHAIAVSKGPGSYTGLRIGVSTAKGLCYGLDIPLVSVNSLLAMANSQTQLGGTLCPMIDARRMEVFTAVFDHQLNELQATHAAIIDEGSFNDRLAEGPVYFFGNGSDKCAEVITHENAHFVKDVITSAESMCSISEQRFNASELEDVAYFEPFYLKEFMATTPKPLV